MSVFNLLLELTFSVFVNSVDLEHVFCQIDANRYNSHIAPPLVVLSTTSYRWFREEATIPL
ncbi:hypothetical protein KKJ15_02025 [Xenorhabdus bovienii]|nr:hypothetical protein [Xenorhabdus bovienii]MDE9520437.1 hypothetical protein [Xenorhabdus bovienii]